MRNSIREKEPPVGGVGGQQIGATGCRWRSRRGSCRSTGAGGGRRWHQISAPVSLHRSSSPAIRWERSPKWKGSEDEEQWSETEDIGRNRYDTIWQQQREQSSVAMKWNEGWLASFEIFLNERLSGRHVRPEEWRVCEDWGVGSSGENDDVASGPGVERERVSFSRESSRSRCFLNLSRPTWVGTTGMSFVYLSLRAWLRIQNFDDLWSFEIPCHVASSWMGFTCGELVMATPHSNLRRGPVPLFRPTRPGSPALFSFLWCGACLLFYF